LNVGPETANPISTVPAALAATTDLEYTSVDENRQITMSPLGGMMGPQGLTGPFQFNGAAFDMNVVNIEVDLNNTEIWTLLNQSALAHPFHIHDVQFNILEINGAAPPPHLQGWKDVVLVPAQMGSVKFITKFEDFADPDIPYMYHCHILIHEEGGMMGQFVVLDREGIDGKVVNELFKLYPNPVSTSLKIELDTSQDIQIFDLAGRTIYKKTSTETNLNIDVSQFSTGVYIVKIGTKTARFIKK